MPDTEEQIEEAGGATKTTYSVRLPTMPSDLFPPEISHSEGIFTVKRRETARYRDVTIYNVDAWAKKLEESPMNQALPMPPFVETAWESFRKAWNRLAGRHPEWRAVDAPHQLPSNTEEILAQIAAEGNRAIQIAEQRAPGQLRRIREEWRPVLEAVRAAQDVFGTLSIFTDHRNLALFVAHKFSLTRGASFIDELAALAPWDRHARAAREGYEPRHIYPDRITVPGQEEEVTELATFELQSEDVVLQRWPGLTLVRPRLSARRVTIMGEPAPQARLKLADARETIKRTRPTVESLESRIDKAGGLEKAPVAVVNEYMKATRRLHRAEAMVKRFRTAMAVQPSQADLEAAHNEYLVSCDPTAPPATGFGTWADLQALVERAEEQRRAARGPTEQEIEAIEDELAAMR